MITTLKEFLNENHSNNDTLLTVWNSEIGTILPESDIYVYVQKLHSISSDFYDGDLGERIEKFNNYQLKLIPIKDINIDEYYLDEEEMEEMMQKYKNNTNYPPIILGKKKYGLYNIIDGNHRSNALNELGIEYIKAWVGKK